MDASAEGNSGSAVSLGRMPVLSTDRIYKDFWSYLWTCTAFSAATWAFLIGSDLPKVGSTLLGIIGYLCGMVLGLVPVTLASGLPSYRYGIDSIDAAKAVFGVNGTVLPLTCSLATLVGWTYVLVALSARGVTNLVAAAQSAKDPNELIACSAAIVVLLATWLAASRGPLLFQRLSEYVAPAQMLVTLVILVLLMSRYGWRAAWTSDISAKDMLTHDHVRSMAYAVEFGVSNSLAFWAVFGGLTRFVEHRKHLVTPAVVGSGVLGAAFISAVAAIAAARSGTSDPTVWLLQVGGPAVGTAMLMFLLAANIITAVILMYLAAVSAQQLKFLTRARLWLVLGVLLLPGLYVAFRTAWVLDNVMTWLSYNGLMFAGITGITLVDYLVIRRQQINVSHLFTRSSLGSYWYWGGVNWVAIAVVLGSTAFYLTLYDPSNYHTSTFFRYFGAGIPTVITAALSYYALWRILLQPLGKGGYSKNRSEARELPVDF
jgi:nucleobase:cation symporter-1, NCS1 family